MQPPVDVRGSRRRGRSREDHRGVTLHIVDPVFGSLVFAGVLVEPGVVEIADYEADPDYWDMIEDDPND